MTDTGGGGAFGTGWTSSSSIMPDEAEREEEEREEEEEESESVRSIPEGRGMFGDSPNSCRAPPPASAHRPPREFSCT